MSRRTSIILALSEIFKGIDGTTPYKINIYGNSYPKLKFWDEVQDFPSVYMSPGSEAREYLPGDFKWGYLNVSIKAYVRDEDYAHERLEELLGDLETCIDANRTLLYDSDNNLRITDIMIQQITTDEGLLAPYGVGEINLQVRYALE